MIRLINDSLRFGWARLYRPSFGGVRTTNPESIARSGAWIPDVQLHIGNDDGWANAAP